MLILVLIELKSRTNSTRFNILNNLLQEQDPFPKNEIPYELAMKSQ